MLALQIKGHWFDHLLLQSSRCVYNQRFGHYNLYNLVVSWALTYSLSKSFNTQTQSLTHSLAHSLTHTHSPLTHSNSFTHSNSLKHIHHSLNLTHTHSQNHSPLTHSLIHHSLKHSPLQTHSNSLTHSNSFNTHSSCSQVIKLTRCRFVLHVRSCLVPSSLLRWLVSRLVPCLSSWLVTGLKINTCLWVRCGSWICSYRNLVRCLLSILVYGSPSIPPFVAHAADNNSNNDAD